MDILKLNNIDRLSWSDYYPFGLAKDSRSNQSSSYRYGFNGKEKDTWSADGNIYDYGFRIYNPQYAKFLSVDPLTKDYTWNSPYAFSENRVIDGVELEGLEYATFHILVVDGITQSIHITKDYELMNRDSEGPGIKYNYTHVNSHTNEITHSSESKENMHGIYQGPKNPETPIVGKPWNKTEYNYNLEPIDETDAAAKQHDLDYDKVKAEGLKGVLSEKTRGADETYVKKAKLIVRKYETKENDSVTGKPVSEETKNAVETGKTGFSISKYLKIFD